MPFRLTITLSTKEEMDALIKRLPAGLVLSPAVEFEQLSNRGSSNTPRVAYRIVGDKLRMDQTFNAREEILNKTAKGLIYKACLLAKGPLTFPELVKETATTKSTLRHTLYLMQRDNVIESVPLEEALTQ